MKNSLKHLAEENKRMEAAATINAKAEINDPLTTAGAEISAPTNVPSLRDW